MPVQLLYPPGPLYAQYRSAEDALGIAKAMHEQQIALRAAHPDFYDPDVHAIVLAFNLRIITRKIDALATAFRMHIRAGQHGGVSACTAHLQSALQQYNGAVACRDARDTPVDATVNVLDMAFDCLASLEKDIQAYEQHN